MSKIVIVLLKSTMAVIMAIAAFVAAIVTAPFILFFWILRFLKEVLAGIK